MTIRVEDVNDNPPAFESDKLTLYIDENSPIGSTVGELHAKDPDEGQNSVVQYSIIGEYYVYYIGLQVPHVFIIGLLIFINKLRGKER